MEHDEVVIEEEPESKIRKVFIGIVGVFLIFLTLSFLFLDYPISNIIRGQLESNPLDGNVVQLEDFSIIFENGVEKELQEIYFNEQEVEFSVCLQGRKDGDYYISSLYQPRMFRQTFNHVQFERCVDSLILLHSHPYKSCLASETDLETLARSREENPDVLMVVMCEPSRFSVY